MPTPHGKTWVEVSRSALAQNAATLARAIGPKVKLMAVVKSNAYGHGINETIRALSKTRVDWFGVDALREANIIRAAKNRKPVLILGYTPLTDLKDAVHSGFSLTVYNHETITALGRIASKKHPAKIHLKLETGTSRQGLLAKDIVSFAKMLKKILTSLLKGCLRIMRTSRIRPITPMQ